MSLAHSARSGRRLWTLVLAAIPCCTIFQEDPSEIPAPQAAETGGRPGNPVAFGGRSEAGNAGDGGEGEKPAPVPACEELEGLGNCGGSSVQAELKKVNLLLVIDKSGSMTDQPDGFDQDKWEAMRLALGEALEATSDKLDIGLLLYPYAPLRTIPVDCESNCCEVPGGASAVNIPIDAGTESVPKILDLLDSTPPGGGTPTALALARAREYFTEGLGADLEGDKYVLLATDGGPNCNEENTCDRTRCTPWLDGQCDEDDNCCAGAGEYCLDDASVLDEIEALREADIPTFVVGIPGTELYAPHLEAFAEAGGVPSDDEQAYYAVSSEGGVQGLVDVFHEITQLLVRSCEVELGTTPSNANLVNVAVDCEVVRPMEDDGSGWELDTSEDPPIIELVGPICSQIRESGARRVDVVYGCPTVE